MELKDYTSRRRFEKTPEPPPEPQEDLSPEGDCLVFVVHKHAARALHYDLRLELDGVLKSWSVPRGPSLNPSTKRLAVMVEDHPLAYRDFEGLIPEGSYGAGSVIVWDRGSYCHPAARERRLCEILLRDGLKKGDLKFVLWGEKLRGEFALVRRRRDDRSWLLLKKKDRYAGTDDVLRENRSVATGMTLEDISATDPEPSFRRRKLSQIRLHEALEAEDLRSAPVGAMPHGIKPMLAMLIREPFDHPDWLFEVKWDGYRAIAELRDGNAALYSRNGISFAGKFSPVAEALRGFRFEAVLDGEIVVVDDDGRSNFQLLQDYGRIGHGRLLYYVFDLLHLAGHDLTGLPLIRRKELLKKILPPSPVIRFSDHVWKDGIAFFRAAREKGLEGIMAKYAASTYRVGSRSRQWLKVKTQLTQEGVIAGFTAPRGSRKHFGALVLGVYEGNELVYIGHTGGGFGARTLGEISAKMAPLVRKTSPFAIVPKTNTPVTWVTPRLVCECAFHGWTDEGIMRQPVFLRLREDKSARAVVREHPRGTAAGPAPGAHSGAGGPGR